MEISYPIIWNRKSMTKKFEKDIRGDLASSEAAVKAAKQRQSAAEIHFFDIQKNVPHPKNMWKNGFTKL